MKDKFADVRHAHQYLSGSVVMLGAKPVYVTEVWIDENDKDRVDYVEVGTNNRANCRIADLTGCTLSLGMTNMPLVDYGIEGRLAFFVRRTPRRMWKVGLSRNNIRFGNVQPDSGFRFPQPAGNYLVSQPFRETLDNKFPDIEAAAKAAKDTKFATAFDRNFAVDNNQEVYFKTFGHPVGSVGSTSGAVLRPQYRYLEQLLEEAVR